MAKKQNYSIQLIEEMYSNVPAFTDLFDEETFYIFVAFFVPSTLVLAFFLSRFITIRAVD